MRTVSVLTQLALPEPSPQKQIEIPDRETSFNPVSIELLRYWCGCEVLPANLISDLARKCKTEINRKRKHKVKRQKINAHLGILARFRPAIHYTDEQNILTNQSSTLQVFPNS